MNTPRKESSLDIQSWEQHALFFIHHFKGWVEVCAHLQPHLKDWFEVCTLPPTNSYSWFGTPTGGNQPKAENFASDETFSPVRKRRQMTLPDLELDLQTEKTIHMV